MAIRHPQLAASIAENIREVAKRKGIGMVALAHMSEVSPSYLFDILGARNAVTVDKLQSIADALEVELPRLLAEPRRR